MTKMLRFIFYRGFVRFIVSIVLGLNVRHREKLPQRGPAIIVANHNSHLDTLVLMSLLPAHLLPKVKPVAAMDYFLRNRLLAWFAMEIIGILPIKQKPTVRRSNPLLPCYDALSDDCILIFYPEGSRGEPETLSNFKSGLARLSEQFPDVPITPIMLHGLGKALPKGEMVLVPFFCDVFIGGSFCWTGDKKSFMNHFEQQMQLLASEGQFSEWE